MNDKKLFDVIITGGSYSGLSAAMSLGRALRKVLVIDNGEPCNASTPYSHNFLTQDGKTPKEISETARKQVQAYPTISFYKGLAVSSSRTKEGFEVKTASGDSFLTRKLVFATGLKDPMRDIKGYKECWGISVLHCPYCHGYEVKHQKTAVLGNGDMGFEFVKMISNWTNDLTFFTNGKSQLSPEQTAALQKNKIPIIERKIEEIRQVNGHVSHIVLDDAGSIEVKAIYDKPKVVQHSSIPADLGCEFNEMGLIKIDAFQKTTQPGVYACGDNSSPVRSVAMAVASGMMTGALLNKELIDEEFNGKIL